MTISVDQLPVAVGFFRNGWSGTTVTNVNDANDATFAQTNGGGNLSYTIDPLPAGATEIISITLKLRVAASTTAWNGTIHGRVYHQGQLIGTLAALGTSAAAGTVVEVTEALTKPDGTAWTPAEVNALEVVALVTADEGFDYHAPNEGRLQRIWLTTVYNDVPPAPSNLTASVVSGTQVDLAWTDNATNETAFDVERATGPGGAFVSIATPAANTVVYSDTTAKPNTLYSYRVKATNASGSSPYSNVMVVSLGVVEPDQAMFTKDNTNARFEVVRNVRHHGYEAGVFVGLTAVRFNIGGGEIGPTNFAGLSDATATAAAVQAAMRAAGAGDETVTYSDSTHKFSVGKAAGTLSLLIASSAHKHIGVWRYLGFNLDADKTGALSYVADNPTFEHADKDHILLSSLNGFRDDTSGTYTGTASARLEKAPDIARFLIERYGPLPPGRFNTASFVAGRLHTTSAVPIYVWIQEREELERILERIENGALAHLAMDSEGSVHYVPYSDTTVRRAFFDRDYLSFRASKVKGNVYRGVRLHYGIRPHSGQRDSVEWVSTDTEVLHNRLRRELRNVETYIRDKADALVAAAQHGVLATANPMLAEFTARGKLVDLKTADVVELTRERCAVSPTGALDAVRFKIAEIRHNYGTGESTCFAVEHLDVT